MTTYGIDGLWVIRLVSVIGIVATYAFSVWWAK